MTLRVESRQASAEQSQNLNNDGGYRGRTSIKDLGEPSTSDGKINLYQTGITCRTGLMHVIYVAMDII